MTEQRHFILLMALSLAALVVAGCQQKESASTAVKVSSSVTSMRKIPVTPVVKRDIEREQRLPGDLMAFRDVGIYPRVPGFIEWLGVDRGSLVKKGQLLIRMNAPELPAQAQQGVDAATAAEDESIQAKEELEMAKQQCIAADAKAKASAHTYERLKGASQHPGIVPGNDLEVAERSAEADAAAALALHRKCKALEAQVKAAAKRHSAAQASSRSTIAMESYLRLTAPFDGIITERNVHEGSFVGPASPSSTPLLRLKQLNVLRLVVPVPESDAGSISPGASLTFSVSAYPGESFAGKVSRVARSIELSTRTMAVELDVPNSDGRLSPGMFAQVVWQAKRQQPVLLVPKSAVVRTTERTFVVRIRDGIVDWVDVKPGQAADGMVEVFGDLNEGDQIANRGSDELRVGMHVLAEATKM